MCAAAVRRDRSSTIACSTAEKQPVPIPVVETGRTDRRLVAIENAGRDEVVIDEQDVKRWSRSIRSSKPGAS